jgi:alanyl-tRNA synthetase
MTARDLRHKYLEFFQSKGHGVYPSGSLIPYDVTGRLDESLLFNGAGMVQFKPFFRGVVEPPSPRLTTAQKCVRTGDIESVGDLTHLTFFEMLGNFSFGDYFKPEAIAYSWEFLTAPEWLGLDPRRLAFTVFEEDDEAYGEWARHLERTGIDPATRVFRLGEETNYWPAGAFSGGPPGPCGPNTEMFYWVSGDEPPPGGPYSQEDYLRDEGAGKWLEIWNDVFIQYEWQGQLRDPSRPALGYEKTGMPSLPFRSVDTGMGLERTAAVLGGMASVYDTDVFQPILAAIRALGPRAAGEEGAVAERIIADHIRTACFCIADGILPSNAGRGYVLRRLIRRAVLKGQRVLGFHEPFFHRVYEGVAQALGGHYRELIERREIIVETLRSEEALFRRTVAAGTRMLEEQLEALSRDATLPGEVAFRLHDTFGFPLEVTRELCDEAGIAVDEEGYEAAMREAQDRSRGAGGMDTVYGSVGLRFAFEVEEKPTPTRFLGYETTESRARIVGVLPSRDETGKYDGSLAIALDQTPFYAESGGQVSDTGRLTGEGIDFEVADIVKQDGVFVHLAHVRRLDAYPSPEELDPADLAQRLQDALFDREVTACVDAARRARVARHHTATHLLHAALRQVLGKHVTQAGSLVSPEHLRFDFTHGKAMTPEELAEVERLVNDEVLKGTPIVVYTDLPIDEARARGAMALFGEKYGDRVRMVEIGDFSRELCGGIHVRHASEVGLFKVVHESSAASGVRRIEAVAGEAAYDWVRAQIEEARAAAAMLKATPEGLRDAVERMLEQLREERRKRERAEAAVARGGGAGSTPELEPVGEFVLWRRKFEEIDQRIVAEAVDDAVARNPRLVAIAALVAEGRVTFIAKCGPQAVAAGAHAGNLVREIAKIAGGGGGGRPDFATAGGKDASRVDAALEAAAGLLAAAPQT